VVHNRRVTQTNPPWTISAVTRGRMRERTSDRVYTELATAIRSLRIPPGAALSETDLAEQLQVSRTPVREAIARLVDSGLVSVIPQVGTRVELIDLGDVEEARFIRESLEVASFKLACARPDRDVSTMRALIAEQKRSHAASDLDGFFEADEAFHQQIFALGGHPGAWSAIQQAKVQLDRLRRLSLPDPRTVRALIDEHTAIADAVAAGDLRGGRKTLVGHLGRVTRDAPALRAKHPDYFTT
jgi:DNA-binding GntR family transcriptional regulator